MTKNKIAIFDIDGTIFRKNLHFELINELVWMKVFPSEIRKTLTETYTDWLEHQGTYENYRQALVGLYSEHIRGCSSDAVKKASKKVIDFHKRRTYIFAEAIIKRLREQEYYILAISGSPQEIVEEYNNEYLKFDQAFGSIYETDANGKYTGIATFEPSKDKSLVARQVIAEQHLGFKDSYAVGDTESDVRILEIVEHPIAFNPNQNLKAIADKESWQVIVEKKDVVYDISAAAVHHDALSLAVLRQINS
ncbi:MAG: HAD-IB family phosphatase [Candidatus Moraniibacteriota bacterium]